jgi:hypothetical protein
MQAREANTSTVIYDAKLVTTVDLYDDANNRLFPTSCEFENIDFRRLWDLHGPTSFSIASYELHTLGCDNILDQYTDGTRIPPWVTVWPTVVTYLVLPNFLDKVFPGDYLHWELETFGKRSSTEKNKITQAIIDASTLIDVVDVLTKHGITLIFELNGERIPIAPDVLEQLYEQKAFFESELDVYDFVFESRSDK